MSKPLDRLTLLETFVAITEAGSISGAARTLGISQPSASRQLAELEDRLQTQLLIRTTHTLAPTAAGRRLIGEAKALIEDWRAIEAEHAADRTTLNGPLKAIVPVALGQTYLADVMLRFAQQHPALQFNWILDDSPQRFRESACDCWIRVGPIPDDTLVVRTLAQIDRWLVASPTLLKDQPRPTGPDDLAALPFVALTPFEGERIPLQQAGGSKAVLKPRAQLRSNNIVAVKKAVASGIGLAVLPQWYVAEDIARGALTRVLPQWQAPTLPLNVAYLPGRYPLKRVQYFVRHLQHEIAESQQLFSG